MSNRSSVFAVCLIGLIVSIPLYHFKSRSLRSIPFEEASVKPNPLTIDTSAYSSIESVLQRAESELKVMYGAKIVDSEKPLLVSLEIIYGQLSGHQKMQGKVAFQKLR